MTTVGYVVIDRIIGRALELSDCYTDSPRHGVLLHGRFGTLFASRRSAHAAIRRTIEYAEKNGLPWQTDRYAVERVSRR